MITARTPSLKSSRPAIITLLIAIVLSTPGSSDVWAQSGKESSADLSRAARPPAASTSRSGNKKESLPLGKAPQMVQGPESRALLKAGIADKTLDGADKTEAAAIKQ